MKNYIIRLWRYLSNPIDIRLDRYLASSSDLADLEHRQQKWFRMSESEKNRWW